MDEFAQSRGDDDLFDDEIVPIDTTQQGVQTASLPIPETSTQTASPPTRVDGPVISKEQAYAGKGRGRGKGRDRGRGGIVRDGAKHGLGHSKFAPKPFNAQTQPRQQDIPISTSVDTDPVPESQQSESGNAADPQEDEKPIDAPTGPAIPTPSRPPAVKGDRLGTGGVQRPKLTEDELNAKLAAAKERNQNRAAAYAREQADAENFAQREKIAFEHRAKETAQRKALEGEREKNRERKLRGQGGREWDAKKNETDYAGRGRDSRQRWAGASGEEENDLSMYEWNDDRGRGRGRGQGRGRGDRGGRSRGRGQYRGTRDHHQPQPNVQAEADFPALPSSGDKTVDKTPQTAGTTADPFESTGGGSWAEQVEAGETGKN